MVVSSDSGSSAEAAPPPPPRPKQQHLRRRPSRLPPQQSGRSHPSLVHDKHVTGIDKIDQIRKHPMLKRPTIPRHHQQPALVPALSVISGDLPGRKLVLVIRNPRPVLHAPIQPPHHAPTSGPKDTWNRPAADRHIKAPPRFRGNVFRQCNTAPTTSNVPNPYQPAPTFPRKRPTTQTPSPYSNSDDCPPTSPSFGT